MPSSQLTRLIKIVGLLEEAGRGADAADLPFLQQLIEIAMLEAINQSDAERVRSGPKKAARPRERQTVARDRGGLSPRNSQ